MARACGNRTHRRQDHYLPLDLKSRGATSAPSAPKMRDIRSLSANSTHP